MKISNICGFTRLIVWITHFKGFKHFFDLKLSVFFQTLTKKSKHKTPVSGHAIPVKFKVFASYTDWKTDFPKSFIS